MAQVIHNIQGQAKCLSQGQSSVLNERTDFIPVSRTVRHGLHLPAGVDNHY